MSTSGPRRPVVPSLKPEIGSRLGAGQDNLVHALGGLGINRFDDWVVKVSHISPHAKDKRDWTKSSSESAKLGTSYKLHKYEILKHFLGDFIPDSMFLVADAKRRGKSGPAEITIQRRVPRTTLNQLTPPQKKDPRLQRNVLELMARLQYMYSVVGEANARSSQGASIDVKLDLGGVSSFVQSHLTDDIEPSDAMRTISKIKSPNLLVDPDTMNLYCIDFDQGDWNAGMNGTMDTIFAIDRHRQARRQAGSIAIGSTD